MTSLQTFSTVLDYKCCNTRGLFAVGKNVVAVNFAENEFKNCQTNFAIIVKFFNTMEVHVFVFDLCGGSEKSRCCSNSMFHSGRKLSWF